jgi:hypothetical protein
VLLPFGLARKAEVERLYELSRSLMMQTINRDVGAQIAKGVRARFGFTTVALCNDPPAALPSAPDARRSSMN